MPLGIIGLTTQAASSPPASSHYHAIEDLTRRYGKDLFARLEGDKPTLFSPTWLDDQMMAWSMDEEQIKVQLFRFIDALPSMIDDTPEVVRHVKEYFELAKDKLPALGRFGLKILPKDGPLAKGVAAMARTNATRLAKRFISGGNVPEALVAIHKLRSQNMTFTIDLLGEAVLTEPEAEHYQAQYLDLVQGLCADAKHWNTIPRLDCDHAGPMPKVNISVKLSSLYSQFDPIDPDTTAEAVKKRLRPILKLIKDGGAFVNIDMEQSSYKDVTLRIIEEIFVEPEFADWPHVGVAIQAYLKSCKDDLARLLRFVKKRGVPMWVRLVKGAYWDYETAICAQNDWEPPVFLQKPESDVNYEICTRFLMENWRWLRPAFGSHNIRSISHALALADTYGVPHAAIEFQLLFGMADPIKKALVQMGQRVRIYTPYGQLLPGMAYLVRRLLENTANQSFLRASFIEHISEDDLLMNPAKLVKPETPSIHTPAGVEVKPMKIAFKNEAPTDYSIEECRAKQRTALAEVSKKFGIKCPLILNGKEVSTSEEIVSLNPSRKSQIVGKAAKASIAQAKEAVQICVKNAESWANTSIEERCKILDKAADLMSKRKLELNAWIIYEAGKQWREADGETIEAIDFCRYYAQEMRKLDAPQRRDYPGEENEYFYEPRGVSVVIGPWNFPFAIPCGMVVASLVTGNPCILKPAEQTSVIAYQLVKILHEAGVPKGVLQYLPGIGEDIGPELVKHPDVALIVFTGSRAVGLEINKTAANCTAQPFVKKVITEMGGKNAIIVDDDADLDQAISGTLAAAFGYQGQKCSACSRVIVLEKVYDTFVNRLIEATKSIKIGPSDEPGMFVGPVIDEDSYKRVQNYITIGKKEGKLAYAAEVGTLADQGYFIGPHIFTEIAPSAQLAQQEVFGPVLAIIKAKNMDDALKIANGTEYALTGGIFSRSPANIARIRREFKVGNLYINRKITGAIVDRQPFGGFKMSGIGSKAGGPDYLLQFVNPRCITENTMRHGFAPVVEGESTN